MTRRAPFAPAPEWADLRAARAQRRADIEETREHGLATRHARKEARLPAPPRPGDPTPGPDGSDLRARAGRAPA